MSPRLRLAAACAVAVTAALAYIAAGSSPSQTLPAAAAAPAATAAVPPMTRTYFVAADEVEWNYAPLGHNGITGEPYGDQEDTFVANGPDRIGSTYRKALYREYTDASFTTSSRARRMGVPGLPRPGHPREVGDTIKIVFRNNTRVPRQHAPAQRLLRQEDRGRAVRRWHGRGRRATTRSRPARRTPTRGRCPSGPVPAQATAPPCCRCTTRTRTRSATRTRGLIGPMVITRAGMAKADGSPIDVDREVFNMFEVADENQSPYLARNIREHAGSRERGPGGRGVRRVEPHALDQRVRLRQAARRGAARRPAGAMVPARHGHRGRSAHAALARQHRRRRWACAWTWPSCSPARCSSST